MAKLVIGNTKQDAVLAVVTEKQPVIDSLRVTPSTSAQTITAPSGTDGYSPIDVSAVDSSIDANIVAGNIKSGVSILGVNGSVVELNGATIGVTPTTSAQTITPTAPNNGFTEVNVSAVTSAIDSNIQAGNIKQGVTILGVAGNYSGITPTGTLPITTNGIYDVSSYANADVQVPTTAPAHYVEKAVDGNGLLQTVGIFNFTNVSDISAFCCAYAFYSNGNGAQNKTINVDMSSITSLSQEGSCEYMFLGQRSSTGYYTELNIDLSGLITITGTNACYHMFNKSSSFSNVFGKINIDLSSLKTINGTNCCQLMFGHFSAISGYLIDFDFPSLETIGGTRTCVGMFEGNNIIKKLSFPKLETISGTNPLGGLTKDSTTLEVCEFNKLSVISTQLSNSSSQSVFGGVQNLKSVNFGGLKSTTFSSAVNQFQYLFNATTGSTATNGCTVHFPSNFDPSDPNHTFDITTLTGYPTFGGSSSYIHLAFDLPATE